MIKFNEWRARQLIKRIDKYDRFIISCKNWIAKDKKELNQLLKQIDKDKLGELI